LAKEPTVTYADADPDFAASSTGHLLGGPLTKAVSIRRWVTVADVPDTELPPLPEYTCVKTDQPPNIDGNLDDAAWQEVEWSAPFGHIDDGALTGYDTRVALRWDDEYLYAAYRVTDPDIRAQTVEHHEHVYNLDDDVEIFVEYDGGYYELGINPINTIYEMRWTWIDRLIDDEDWPALEALFMTPEYLYYTRRSTERLGRLGDRDYDLPGLKTAVRVDGSINHPGDVDNGWTVEFALPWASFAALSRSPGQFPPTPGDTIRIQAYRAQHDWGAPTGEQRIKGGQAGRTPYEGYTWSTMGNGNVHNPERWIQVTFAEAGK